jgi:hypothetical protein
MSREHAQTIEKHGLSERSFPYYKATTSLTEYDIELFPFASLESVPLMRKRDFTWLRGLIIRREKEGEGSTLSLELMDSLSLA